MWCVLLCCVKFVRREIGWGSGERFSVLKYVLIHYESYVYWGVGHVF